MHFEKKVGILHMSVNQYVCRSDQYLEAAWSNFLGPFKIYHILVIFQTNQVSHKKHKGHASWKCKQKESFGFTPIVWIDSEQVYIYLIILIQIFKKT